MKRVIAGCQALAVLVTLTACYFSNVPSHFIPEAFQPAQTSPLSNQRISGMATDGNVVVAVSSMGNIAWSEDHGVNWDAAYFKNNGAIDDISFNDVVWAEGYYFAGANSGKAAWSRDGKEWNAGVIGPMNPQDIRAVAAGRIRQQLVFVAAGTRGRTAYAVSNPAGPWYQIAFSPFGDQADSEDRPYESVNALAHGIVKGCGVFVAVGDNGKIAIMNDFSGGLYGPSAAGTQLPFLGVGFGNERFIAVGEGATLKISADPENYTWTTIRDSDFSMQVFSKIGFAPAFNYFIMITGESIVRFSEYGENWTASNFSRLFPGGISAIAGTKKKIILGGGDGEIYYSN